MRWERGRGVWGSERREGEVRKKEGEIVRIRVVEPAVYSFFHIQCLILLKICRESKLKSDDDIFHTLSHSHSKSHTGVQHPRRDRRIEIFHPETQIKSRA